MEAENRRIVELAAKFDKLQLDGYYEILDHITEKVNAELAKARHLPFQCQEQLLHVVRWCAMAEILDEQQHFVANIMKQRDEIVNPEPVGDMQNA